ncbi:hypothetical protein UKMH10_0495 [Burkholderia pseudomallei]|nr:hypothetical protein UKMH10_0495 [Burkholderia pseudomallei]
MFDGRKTAIAMPLFIWPLFKRPARWGRRSRAYAWCVGARRARRFAREACIAAIAHQQSAAGSAARTGAARAALHSRPLPRRSARAAFRPSASRRARPAAPERRREDRRSRQ